MPEIQLESVEPVLSSLEFELHLFRVKYGPTFGYLNILVCTYFESFNHFRGEIEHFESRKSFTRAVA